MFSSIASFLFGSSTAATAANCETNLEPTDAQQPGAASNNNNNTNQPEQQPNNKQQQLQRRRQSRGQRKEEEQNTINLTSVTPSVVTGAGNGGVVRPVTKRGKNKRNNRKTKRGAAAAVPTDAPTPKLAQLLTPSDADDDFDEDDWFIVEKEDEDESLPRTDSEEEFSLESNKPNSPRTSTPVRGEPVREAPQQQQRRRHQQQQQHISSHSQYGGPRPQQQRNRQQRARNNIARNSSNAASNGRRSSGGTVFNRAALSPARSLQCNNSVSVPELADAGLLQSLYVVSGNQESGHNVSGASSDSSSSGNKLFTMVDSWYVTPPPCFTSIGPVNVVTSPFENLLIEHPSMSVYHSIRSAQEAADSFVNLDLGVKESQQQEQMLQSGAENSPEVMPPPTTNASPTTAVARRHSQAAPVAGGERGSGGPRINRYTAAELKLQLFARNTQKCQVMKERQSLCRTAMKRANKVRDYQGNGNRQRRADMQHCKVISGANNNRKCCF